MTDLQLKFRFIFVRFLTIAVVFIPVYTFFNWYAVIYKEWWPLDEGLVNFLFPAILSFAIVWPLMWRRIKLLIFKTRSGKDPKFGLLMIASIAIAIPAIIAQEYISTATGKLSKLQTINDIALRPKTKYYTVQKYFVSKNLSKMFKTSGLTGKHHNTLTWNKYVVCPIFKDSLPYPVNLPGPIPFRTDSVKLFATKGVTSNTATIINGKAVSRRTALNLNPDAISEVRVYPPQNAIKVFGKGAADGAMEIILREVPIVKPVAWLCLHFTDNINANAKQTEKDSAYKVFNKNSYVELMNTDLNKFDHLHRMGRNSMHDRYIEAVNTGYNFGNDPVILEPVFEPYEERNGNKLIWLFGAFGIGSLVFFLMLLKPTINKLQAGKYIKHP